MNTFGYILNSALVLVVVLQLRERKFDRTAILLPLAIVAVAVAEFLHSIPSGGNDLLLDGTLVAAGALAGVLCAAFTAVRPNADGIARIQAGKVAAIVWILGVGARMAFAYASTHGSGPSIARFSIQNSITGGSAWTAALVMMGLATVLARLAVLYVRAHRVSAAAAAATAEAAARAETAPASALVHA